MARYYFRIQQGAFSGVSERGTELSDDHAAWGELARVAGNLLGSIARKLQQNNNWQIELLDEARKPKFRINLVGETVVNGLASPVSPDPARTQPWNGSSKGKTWPSSGDISPKRQTMPSAKSC
jgi:hypothetical protein